MKRYYLQFSWRHSLLVWLAGMLILSAALFYLITDLVYAGKVFPGVHLGDRDLSGQRAAIAKDEITQLIKSLPRQLVAFRSPGFIHDYSLKELGVVFLPEANSNAVVNFGREKGQPFLNLWNRLRAMLAGVKVAADYQEQLDLADRVMGRLREQVDRSGVDGEVIITNKKAQIKPAVTGQILDGTTLQRMLRKRWQKLDWTPVDLPIKLAPPLFSDEVTQLTADKINQNLAVGFRLTARERDWIITPDKLWQWVEVIKQNNALAVRLRPNDLQQYLEDLKTQVDQPMQNAVFTLKDQTVTKFQPDQPGVSLRVADTADLIQTVLLSDQRTVALAADYIEPKTKLSNLNDLGINELVARGESNFAGSPVNRRHNIKVGAAKFDKVIISANTTFSFNKILGDVSATTGYLEELVIKGDTTMPEFGGGLCQVSTTTFRAALSGGYPITARHNHTYRVSYYEPAGTDATVYQPYPDLKFLNDTPYPILIHTYIDTANNDLYFDFYSTKTGQRVELEGPKIYNITEPPPPVYIETSDLPEGVEKKIDTAHRGAETILYRHIYDANGQEIRKDTFKSFYIPWPAKYLVGAKTAPTIETNLGNVPPETTAAEPPVAPLPPIITQP